MSNTVARSTWNYGIPIDITNSATSVYANAIDELIYEDPETLPNEEVGVQAEDEYDIEINRKSSRNDTHSYKYGRPDSDIIKEWLE